MDLESKFYWFCLIMAIVFSAKKIIAALEASKDREKADPKENDVPKERKKEVKWYHKAAEQGKMYFPYSKEKNQMSISFKCPKCGQKLSTPEEMRGQQGQCPHCDFIMIVPEQSPDPPKINKITCHLIDCPACGNKVSSQASVCPKCGQTIYTPSEKGIDDNGKMFGILGLVSGVIGVLVLPIIFGPCAILLGIVAVRKNYKYGWWGIVLGGIDIIVIIPATYLLLQW